MSRAYRQAGGGRRNVKAAVWSALADWARARQRQHGQQFAERPQVGRTSAGRLPAAPTGIGRYSGDPAEHRRKGETR